MGNLHGGDARALHRPGDNLVAARGGGKHLEVARGHVAGHIDVVDAPRRLAALQRGDKGGGTGGRVDGVNHDGSGGGVEHHVGDEQIAGIINEHIVAREIGGLDSLGQSQVAKPLAGGGIVDAQIALCTGAVLAAPGEIELSIQHRKRAVERAVVLLLKVVVVALYRANPVAGDGHTGGGGIGVGSDIGLHHIARLGVAYRDAGDGECAGFAHTRVAARGSGGHAPVVGALTQQRYHALRREILALGLEIIGGEHNAGKPVIARHLKLVALGSHIANQELEVVVDFGTIGRINQCGLWRKVALQRCERRHGAAGVEVAGEHGSHAPVVAGGAGKR